MEMGNIEHSRILGRRAASAPFCLEGSKRFVCPNEGLSAPNEGVMRQQRLTLR
jgi:hypothetical protein